jgi:prevent-host-death family protein
MYASAVDVSISKLRSELATWIARAQAGEEVLITDRGTPVARLCPVESSSLIDRLVREGVLTLPAKTTRTRSKDIKQVRARSGPPVSDYIGENRR